ncbi:NAD(P)/FAD-dependent oxidoreductase [Leisingera daeponensis]|uniref:NAD(P)/FAD-dependent oxidoreductase n=1 Tax=Leisingera daeponensis TaxID=405746 RepID=UPI001C94DFBE|nr:FAD-binding oxidoreductase [Leisingera daeponensis]MBY6058544.1 FAD-binding oxidoreductase [Leisingera daeponensis]
MTSDLASCLWHQTCQENPAFPDLAGEAEADLVVIGGGYTGCSAALKAAGLGASVRLIEAEDIGSGGSGRNVGLANAGLWLPPEDINAELGAKAGNRLSALLAGAPGMVFSLIEKHAIRCEPERSGTLHCAHAPTGLKDLQRRHAQLTAIGAPVELLPREDAVRRTGSDAVHGALFDPRAGTIQPLAYVRGLARAAAGAGAQLHGNSPATAISRKGSTWHVATPKGSIRARHLIMATNAYARGISGYDAPQVIPVHYFQAATDPLPAALLQKILPGKEGCWDTALVMSSWRLDEAGRLVIGGMGALNHCGSALHRNWLPRKLAALYPDLKEAKLRSFWHGRIAMTTEHLPKILDLQGGFACFGYSGRGIGPGTLFGAAMAEALLTGDSACLPVPPVRDHAIPFASLRSAYYETGAALTHLVSNR